MHFPRLPDWLVYASVVLALLISAIGRQERADAPPPPPPVPGEEGLPLGPASPFDPAVVVDVPDQAEPGAGTAFSVADDAAQVYRLHLAQAESRASMAERRASAAEDAMETMSALCSDARRDAEAASRAAERDRRELRRRESELAMRRALASSSENPEHPLVSPLKSTVIAATPVRTHRPMAPFPTPPRDSAAIDSPALAELQNLRRSLERFDNDDDNA